MCIYIYLLYSQIYIYACYVCILQILDRERRHDRTNRRRLTSYFSQVTIFCTHTNTSHVCLCVCVVCSGNLWIRPDASQHTRVITKHSRPLPMNHFLDGVYTTAHSPITPGRPAALVVNNCYYYINKTNITRGRRMV